MYPQKFTFEDLQHRTAKAGDLYSFIYLINSELEKKKEGQATVLRACPLCS
jgi:site-specific DNA recombinase